jgi:branched-chain amino acid transport system substrate-binding protein
VGDFFCFKSLSLGQTKFPFRARSNHPLVKETEARALRLFPDLSTIDDLMAPAGFVHAFDITLILAAAADQAGLAGDIKADRSAVHHALENLKKPVSGLIKTYIQPFSAYHPQAPDAHEALGPGDYRMGMFNTRGQIVPAKR